MGRVTFFEIEADDPARAKTFYETVFGWKIEKWDGATEYWLINTGGEGAEKSKPGIDGAIQRRQGHPPTHDNPVSAYVCTIDVANLDEAMKRVVKEGGNIMVDKRPVPGVGWLCYCKDTEGNVFGMMQSDEQAK